MENEITELVVCGMMTHMCIDSTMRAAKDYGYKITLISNGCATKDLNGWRYSRQPYSEHYMASLNQKFANIKLGSEMF